jgi:hypothetical protein
MRVTGRFGALAVAGFLALGACRSSGEGELAAGALPLPAERWVVAAENDSLRISIDTTGWSPTQPRAVLWIALNNVSTTELRQSNSPFHRFETRQELDCGDRRARGLDIRVPDSTGQWRTYPVADSSWQPFATARLDQSILAPVCVKLAQLASSGR